MSKFKQILKELCGTAFNIPAGELTELLEKSEDDIKVDDVAKALKDKYRDNLTVFGKTQKDEGFKAAERSTSKKFEESLKTAFNITSDKQGEQLISEIIEANSKKPKPGKEMSEDDIKKSDVYLKMENTFKAQLKAAQDEGDKKLSELQKEYTKKETFGKVSAEISKLLDAEGYFFDDDPTRAANKREDFLSKFAGHEYDFKDNQIIISKDGKVLENEFGHKVDFKDFVNGLASRYYPKKVSDRRNSPNGQQQQQQGNQQQQQQSSYSGALPKNAEEYDSLMSNESVSIADKLKIQDHWEKSQAPA